MNHANRLIAVAALSLGIVAAPFVVRAESDPRSTAADSRVRLLTYDENQVYRLVAYYGYGVDLELAPDEEVKVVAAGDTVGWQIYPAGHHVFIKPMAAYAHTNLSLVTSRRTYVFDLIGRESRPAEEMTYLVRFEYPHASPYVAASATNRTAADFNFTYRLSGSKALRPTRVFDDGQFTYFQFESARQRELPAIFVIDANGQESLINYRMQGAYMVVERLGESFRLRSGKKCARVDNQARPAMTKEN